MTPTETFSLPTAAGRDLSTSDGQFAGNDLFQLFIASVTDYAMFVLDPDGFVRTWNEGARRIKGYEANEIIGQYFSIFYLPGEVKRRKPQAELAVAAVEGRFEDEGWRIRKDGSRFWANVIITALFQGGRLVGYAKVTRDLTERRKGERRQAASQAMVAERDRFLSVAAHELKTPVTAMNGFIQLLERRLIQSDADIEIIRDHVRMLSQQCGKLLRLLNQLLDVSRLEAGQLQVERRPQDIGKLVGEVVEMARARSESHEIAVDVEPGLTASIDALRMEQVLMNLLDNAIKFSPPGGSIEVSARADSDMVELNVRDHGPGIAPSHRRHIFERFYQAHSTNRRSGLGLGLAISREIVERHNGTLQAEFPADGGTCMVVRLPLDSTAVTSAPCCPS
ncbi:MAG: PAS domain-containing sensor histidine kinase [Chloroflexota bacterium]